MSRSSQCGSRRLTALVVLLTVVVTTSTSVVCVGDEGNDGPFRVACDALKNIIDIENRALFERVPGSYRIDRSKSTWMSMAAFGQPNVVIPKYNYEPSMPVNTALKSKRFIEKASDTTVDVSTLSKGYLRTFLSRALHQEVFEKYRGRHVFTFFEEALGVHVDGFRCTGVDSEESIAMLVSSGIPPIHGSKTKVYRLTDPRALLLVPTVSRNNRSALNLIFPDAKDIDVLDIVSVFTSRSRIEAIVSSLRRNR